VSERRRPGEVRDAIVAYLQILGSDAAVQDIQQAVNEQFHADVPASSIRSSLRLSTLFERTSFGRYRLKTL
jgi:hypothetical protein